MWAESYVGLPFKRMGRDVNGLDCWGLVRLVLADQLGKVLPRFDNEDADGLTIESLYRNFTDVVFNPIAFDVSILMMEVRVGLIWKLMPVHIGIFINSKKILHINEGELSRIDKASSLRIYKIVRVI